MEPHWAVLRTQVRREVIAARAVSARGVEPYLPWLPGARGPDTAQPLFPGYLFARITPDSDDLLRIRSAPGVAYVLPRAGTPALLPQLFIDSIRAHEHAARTAHGRGFRRGDRVLVVSGPFKWVEGLFDRSLSASGRVRILLDLVHGTLAVQIAETELEPAAKRFRNEKLGVALANSSSDD
jgi:transcriptional antiterminator RfaH